LNKGKRADTWFWSRYSAYPYLGCQHGCEFCYCRESKYSPYDDPNDFAYVIRVKENAAQLLRKALLRAPVDVIFTGDYQPAERKFGISRQMLEVCLELGFPVFILERSSLVLRDLDLIQAIHQKARAGVAFSIISTPDSPNYARVRQIEKLAAPPEKRFAAMQALARQGIPTGTCFMPILPGLCDDDENLQAVVRWTAEHGGQYVIASGLTLSDQQRQYFLGILSERFPDLLASYQRLYPPGSYSSPGWPWSKVALRISELCAQAGIFDRIPRPIIPGEKRALNKRIVEILANKVYRMEINNEAAAQVWAYRKASWAIEDLQQDIRLIYSQMGLNGLKAIPDVGPRLAVEIETLVQAGLKTGETQPSQQI
jgi:DNA repair photolyase